MILRIVGLGYEPFFKDKWNSLDFVLVVVILAAEIAPNSIVPHHSDVIIKMFRIFRIATLIKLIRGEKNNLKPDH
jgi:hypothetical protein